MTIPLRNLLRVALIVAIILLMPLVMTIHDGAVEGVGWNWTPSDFSFMGGLLLVAGLAIDFALRKLEAPGRRFAAIAVIVLIFLAIWTELAVDSIGQLVRFILG